MKRTLLSLLFASYFLSVSSAQSQQTSRQNSIRVTASQAALTVRNSQSESFRHNTNTGVLPNSIVTPLSTTVALDQSVTMPLAGRLDVQSNGRALHNIQVDPSNPLNIHAAIMQDNGNDIKHDLTLRRVYYLFSHDGGQTWSAPKALTTNKSGYPSLILYKRGGNYVPIIGLHHVLPNDSTHFVSAILVEKGNPGDGNFEMTDCDRVGFSGAHKDAEDIIWPYIGVSPAGDKVYMIGSISTSVSKSYDEHQFGTFNLDGAGHAKWNGWNAAPGTGDGNYPNAAYDVNGNHVLRVSSSGKIGIIWKNADFTTPDASLYYDESTDGGKTWATEVNVMTATALQGSSTIYNGPWDGMDFFFLGEQPAITWTGSEEAYDGSTGRLGDTYYPSAASLYFMLGSTGQLVILADDSLNTAALYNLKPIEPAYPIGSHIKENDPWITYPTIAQSKDPNQFSIFYQIFQRDDSVQHSDTVWNLYGSIYYQSTSDGGQTWTAPTPFKNNTPTPNGFGKTDYRAPEVSDFNPTVGGKALATVLFFADTLAGPQASDSIAGYDAVGSYFAQLPIALGVGQPSQPLAFDLNQNYPNPFNPSTTISFNLKSSANALVEVRDMMGRLVGTVVSGKLTAGPHSYIFDASGLTSGIYYYSLKANGQSYSRTMTLLK